MTLVKRSVMRCLRNGWNGRWNFQFMAQAGITYAKDPYDLERFQRLREIAAEIMSAKSGLDMGTVRGLFCSETGFQTPKMDTRAAIFREGKILLVKEKGSGLWSMPGGWVDVNQSVRDNTNQRKCGKKPDWKWKRYG